MEEFQFISDVHLEQQQPSAKDMTQYFKEKIIKPEKKNIILAGDIADIRGDSQLLANFLEYCSTNWVNVYYVLGNHEFYHTKKTYHYVLQKITELCDSFHNVYLLNNNIIEFDTHYIIGSTLFSEITVKSPHPKTLGFNNFNHIKMKNDKKWTVPISIEFYNNLAIEQKKWLTDTVKSHTDKPLIVVTHYPLVKMGTIDKKYLEEGEINLQHFVNDIDLSEFTDQQIIAISGHTHFKHDFTIGNINYLSNPYLDE